MLQSRMLFQHCVLLWLMSPICDNVDIFYIVVVAINFGLASLSTQRCTYSHSLMVMVVVGD